MTVAMRHPDAPHEKRWSKAEYERLVDAGAFEGKHLFLFRGGLVHMSPQSADHAWSVRKTTAVMGQLFAPPTFFLNVQLPFGVPGDSLVEPDIAVCRANELVSGHHADKAILVIEVAVSSLPMDREKAVEYAAAGVIEYWIVDLNGRSIEVYRSPINDTSALLGHRYSSMTVHREQDIIAPLSAPRAAVKVADLLL